MKLLLLQGPASGFFARLGAAAAARGHAVAKVNFCAGDDAVWARPGALRFAGDGPALVRFYNATFRAERPDAIGLFGDSRPIHRVAIAVAREHGIPVWAFDEGYLRPHWVTMDLGGTGPNSALPRGPARLRALAAQAQAPDPVSIPAAWLARAAEDTRYRLANALHRGRYPGYRGHRPFSDGAEYAAWIRRYLRDLRHGSAHRRAYAAALAGEAPLFVLPLQLDHDFAIRRHAPVRDMAEVLGKVLRSFARHAPAAARLAIKRHPLDPDFGNRHRAVAALAQRLGIADRVAYFAGGNLDPLLARAAGVVTVNSTVGTRALELGRPVRLLADAVYNIDGLVARQPLAEFWSAPRPPAGDLFAAFRCAALHFTQIGGSLYGARGQCLAAAAAVARFESQAATIAALAAVRAAPGRAAPGFDAARDVLPTLSALAAETLRAAARDRVRRPDPAAVQRPH